MDYIPLRDFMKHITYRWFIANNNRHSGFIRHMQINEYMCWIFLKSEIPNFELMKTAYNINSQESFNKLFVEYLEDALNLKYGNYGLFEVMNNDDSFEVKYQREVA